MTDRSKDKGQRLPNNEIYINSVEDIFKMLRPGDDEDSIFLRDSAKAFYKELQPVAAPETPQPQGRFKPRSLSGIAKDMRKSASEMHHFAEADCEEEDDLPEGQEAKQDPDCCYKCKLNYIAEELEMLAAASPTGQEEQRQLQIKVHLEEIKRNTAVYESLRGKECFIFAGDGGCYWKANACGYTDLANAAAYKFEEAYSLTHHCGTEKRIEFHFFDRPAPSVPIREALEKRLYVVVREFVTELAEKEPRGVNGTWVKAKHIEEITEAFMPLAMRCALLSPP